MNTKLFKRIVFGLAAVICFNTFADDVAKICAEKEKQYGKSFRSCKPLADWGTPLAADYHSTNFQPGTAAPSEIRNSGTNPNFKNHFPELKDTRKNMDAQYYTDLDQTGHAKYGLPINAEFVKLVESKEGENSAIAQYLRETWYQGMQPNPNEEAWVGGCRLYSSFSNDHLRETLAQIKKVFGCDGFTFEKGAIKDLFLDLSPRLQLEYHASALSSVAATTKNYISNGDADRVEDGNIALSKMGLSGNGLFTPNDFVYKILADAKANGKGLMYERNMHLNPARSNEIWNQPVSKVIQVTYVDPNQSSWEIVSSTDLQAASGQDQDTYNNLSNLEMDFARSLPQGQGPMLYRLCELRKRLGESCDDVGAKIYGNNPLSLTEQTRLFTQIKKDLIEKNILQFKTSAPQIVHHELIFEYGEENKYGSDIPDEDRLVHKSFDYVTVFAQDAKTGEMKESRSQWTPPSRPLSEICGDRSMVAEREGDMASSADFAQKCNDWKAGKISGQTPFFTQLLPPVSINSFHRLTENDWSDADHLAKYMPKEKAEALFKLDQMIRTNCGRGGKNPYDQTAIFLSHLDNALKDNVISPEEKKELQAEYPDAKYWLESDWRHVKALREGNANLEHELKTLFP